MISCCLTKFVKTCILFLFSAQILGSFFLPKLTYAEGEVLLDGLDAYVNSSPILHSDVEKYQKNIGLRAQIDPLFPHSNIAKKGRSASQTEIIDSMIKDQLVEKEYPKTDAEVEQEISTIQTNNHIDRNTLKEALQREGYSFSDYFELIRDSASKKELIGREIQTKINVSEEDIKNYFSNHLPKGSKAPHAFHLELISINLKNYKSLNAAQKVAKEALKDLKSGEPFEEVAKRISDDPSASSGGDLGSLTEEQMAPEIRNEVKKLKVGEISGLFDAGNNRQYILKLNDIKTSENDQFDKVKEEIRSQLMAKEYEQQVKLWEERKRQSAVIHISGASTLAPIAPIAPIK